MFGSQSSTSLFGAPSSGNSLFGGATAPGGLPAAGQSPLLAGASQPGGIFGGNSASASLFGTPVSSGGLFGTPASSAGGLFGTPAPSSGGGLFGTPAASTGGGLFGAPAASGSIFGSPASGGTSLFGASSSSLFTSGGASTGGLFGAPASSGGLFGAPSSAGMFGGGLGQSSSSFLSGGAVSPWGALPNTSQQAPVPGLAAGQDPAHFHAEQAAIKNGLEEMQHMCTPTSPKCPLTHLFLYVLDKSQHVRPPNIDQAQWEAALARAGGPDNPDGLWPVAVHGVQQLKAHHDAQQEALQDNRNCLAELRAVVHTARQGVGIDSMMQQRSEHLLQQHARLSHLLLQTIRFVDTLSARIVTSTDCRAMDIELEAVAQLLSQIEAHLAPNNVQGLKHQVDTLRSQMQGLAAENGSATTVGVDDNTMKQAAHILQEHNKGIKRMQAHLDKIERHIAVITPN